MEKQRVLRIEYSTEYPWVSIVVAMALILASPFVSVWLNYVALVICLYRVICYDAKIFATDYAILTPVVRIFKTSGGLSLLIILCLIAAVVLIIREGVKADRAFVLLIAILNYLIARMQMEFTNFLLCFGQMFLLWVLLPKQDAQSAIRTAKLYCISLLTASVYAAILNGTWQIQALIGAGSEAFWGTGIMRFHGLIGDPNFYMAELIVGLALAAKLKETGNLKTLPFVLMGIAMAVMGALTYSKTFLLVFVIFGATYILWQFRNKKIFWGILLIVAVVVFADVLLFSEASPFSGVVQRLLEGESLDDISTGRMEVFARYGEAIVKTPLTFFFGYGLGAPILEKAPHNIALEILYHSGLVGLLLIGSFMVSIISTINKQAKEQYEQSFIAKYIVLAMVLLIFLALNGMFMVEVYPNFFLAVLAILIPPKQEQEG